MVLLLTKDCGSCVTVIKNCRKIFDAGELINIDNERGIKFSDWAKDKWIVMFSHPADFIHVCTNEMSKFAEREAEFEAMCRIDWSKYRPDRNWRPLA